MAAKIQIKNFALKTPIWPLWVKLLSYADAHARKFCHLDEKKARAAPKCQVNGNSEQQSLYTSYMKAFISLSSQNQHPQKFRDQAFRILSTVTGYFFQAHGIVKNDLIQEEERKNMLAFGLIDDIWDSSSLTGTPWPAVRVGSVSGRTGLLKLQKKFTFYFRGTSGA